MRGNGEEEKGASIPQVKRGVCFTGRIAEVHYSAGFFTENICAMADAQVSINLKPNKPEAFEWHRDYLVVNTWLYKIEQYIAIILLSNPNVTFTDEKRIMYASAFLTGIYAVWWYTLAQNNTIPTTWEQFKAKVIAEGVAEDHVRCARDRLRKLQQNSSVAKYLSELRNELLTIPGKTDGEMWDKFRSGMKFEVHLEVMKSTVTAFEDATKVAL